MKNLIKHTLIFIAIFSLFSSCNDDFMERYPQDEITSQTFWNTESDLKNYNNSLYDKSGECINLEHRYFLDAFTDNYAPINTFMDYNRVRAGFHTVEPNPRVYGYRNWNLLRDINFGLANYHKATVDENTINKYAAEARFFRAWFYADKIQKFGKANWISEPLNIDSQELYSKRDSRDEVMNNVLDDINFAIEHLPEKWTGEPVTATSGRFNKWHALLIKSRICLFEGTFRKYHKGSDFDGFLGDLTGAEMWLEEAASAAKKIIDDGPFQIYMSGDPQSDYRDAFSKFKLNGHPEVLYWHEYEVGINNSRIKWDLNDDIGGVTKEVVDDYLCTNGLPVIIKEGINSLYAGDDTLENVFKNRDPRMRQTIMHPDDIEKVDYFPGILEGAEPHLTGYYLIKFSIREDVHPGTTPAVVMRFAEVLLNYAEAKAELGTITQNDLDITINQLRERVNLPHLVLGDIPDDPRYENISPLITEIRRERRIELLGEGFRYMDLLRWRNGNELETPDLGMRWNDVAKERFLSNPNVTMEIPSQIIEDPITGEMKEYISPYKLKGEQWINPVFDESKHYLWPLPLSSLSQNDNLEQNPEWK